MAEEPRKTSYSVTEVAEVANRVTEALAQRPIVRGITIDGPTSKDLDDGFWLERLPTGGYRLQVSIADVASFVNCHLTPEIDRVAFAKAFTRYYGEQQNNPMLPRSLSEESLSLLEGLPRPAITLNVEIDEQLRISEPEFALTRFENRQRWSYGDVDRVIDRPENEVGLMLQLSYNLAYALLQQRRAKGALALYDLHSGWATTEEGQLRLLGESERYKAQIIIQEFMILSNQTYALFFARRGIPVLYRNHKATAVAPERSSLLEMISLAALHPESISPERVRTTVNLAMERARYGPTVEGHFALNLPAYIHMTSPLRRYADLVSQRIMVSNLRGEPSPYTKEELIAVAAHINALEDKEKDAKKAHFLAQYDKGLQGSLTLTEKEEEKAILQLSLEPRKFHSLIRMAAEQGSLSSALEEEITRRLKANLLKANDVFIFLFRFPGLSSDWQPLKRLAMQWLYSQPHQAVSLLVMGHQSLKWGELAFELTSQGNDNQRHFRVRAHLVIGNTQYHSQFHTARQKDRAKQLASVDLLSQLAGLPEEKPDTPPLQVHVPEQMPIEETQIPIESTPVLELDEGQNYKGQLQELAQAHNWDFPLYQEEARSGLSHSPIFTVMGVMVIDGQNYRASGKGNTKMKAEQRVAWQLLQVIPHPTKQSLHVEVLQTKNAVGVLNEQKQQNKLTDVRYEHDADGPPHQRRFSADCWVTLLSGKQLMGKGEGSTKKEALQDAALQVLRLLAIEEHGDKTNS